MGNELLIKFVIGRYSQEEININMSHGGIIFKPATLKSEIDNINQAQAAQKSGSKGYSCACPGSLIIYFNINLKKVLSLLLLTHFRFLLTHILNSDNG